MTDQVTIAAATAADDANAEALSTRLALPLGKLSEVAGLVLVARDGSLELADTNAPNTLPLKVDFDAGRQRHRRLHGGGELLRRVLGKPDKVNLIIDAGAGLGADSFVMATLGFRVLAVERSPVIHALLEDGLARAERVPDLAQIVARIELHQGDALEFLSRLIESKRPDVIHLDPMYPERRKSALGRLELRLVRALVGDDEDAAELLAVARQQARRRVLVKRPKKAVILGGQPGYTVEGKTVRYDVYPCQSDN